MDLQEWIRATDPMGRSGKVRVECTIYCDLGMVGTVLMIALELKRFQQ